MINELIEWLSTRSEKTVFMLGDMVGKEKDLAYFIKRIEQETNQKNFIMIQGNHDKWWKYPHPLIEDSSCIELSPYFNGYYKIAGQLVMLGHGHAPDRNCPIPLDKYCHILQNYLEAAKDWKINVIKSAPWLKDRWCIFGHNHRIYVNKKLRVASTGSWRYRYYLDRLLRRKPDFGYALLIKRKNNNNPQDDEFSISILDARKSIKLTQ
ncbi:MAG: metallophosphoesterase, partial [Candidatus Hodarchaeota archaeon]